MTEASLLSRIAVALASSAGVPQLAGRRPIHETVMPDNNDSAINQPVSPIAVPDAGQGFGQQPPPRFNPDDAGADEPTAGTARGASLAPQWHINLLGAGLIVLGFLLAWLLASLWPGKPCVGDACQPVTLALLGYGPVNSLAISFDQQLLLLVMVAGGLGSFIHTATSFADFVGNRQLTKSWLWWYGLKPFIAMALAVVFYTMIRAGFLSTNTQASELNPFGIVAMAGLAGMFTKQATDKLSEVFSTMFKTSATGGDAARQDSLETSAATGKS